MASTAPLPTKPRHEDPPQGNGRGDAGPDAEGVEDIIAEAERLAAAEGLRGVAMRRIATNLKISPGTIYYRLGDLDQVILHVNARTLGRLRRHLASCIDPAKKPLDNALAVADGYLDFVMAQPRLWGLVSEYTMPAGTSHPPWYVGELATTTGFVDKVLSPLIADRAERARSVATLWASLQGIASAAVTGKLAAVHGDGPRELARLLVRRYLAGAPDEA